MNVRSADETVVGTLTHGKLGAGPQHCSGRRNPTLVEFAFAPHASQDPISRQPHVRFCHGLFRSPLEISLIADPWESGSQVGE